MNQTKYVDVITIPDSQEEELWEHPVLETQDYQSRIFPPLQVREKSSTRSQLLESRPSSRNWATHESGQGEFSNNSRDQKKYR